MELASPDGEEGAPLAGETPRQFVLRLSLEKARLVASKTSDAIVLGADTAVVLDGDVLGKPDGKAEAVRMLRKLRGRVHTVVTGVTALDSRSGRWLSAAKATDVTMRDFSDEEVAAYVASGDSLDKAGGYAIQDEAFRPARDTFGCYLNVVGLPMCEVVGLLEGLGVQVRLRQGWQLAEQCRDCPLEQRMEVNRAWTS